MALEIRHRKGPDEFYVPYRNDTDDYTRTQDARRNYAANRAVWDSPVVVEMWHIDTDDTEYQIDTLTCSLQITVENLADEVDDTDEEVLQ